jgi:glucosamine-phosphate N-acetyltransferase
MEIKKLSEITLTITQKNQYLNLLNQLTTVFKDDEEKNKMINDFDIKIKQINNHIFILLDGDNIIGSISVLLESKIIHNFGICGHIEDVVIDSNYRGYKLGNKLLNHAINFCKNKSCYKIILNCKKELINFYKKNGFNEKDIQMTYYF